MVKKKRKHTKPSKTDVSYESLPSSVRSGIEKVLAYRKRLNLPDDSVERKAKAVKYYNPPA